jgi:hypothetical protein
VRADELLLIHISAVVEIAPLRFVLVGGEQQLQQMGKRGASTLPAGRDRLGSLKDRAKDRAKGCLTNRISNRMMPCIARENPWAPSAFGFRTTWRAG